MLKTIIAVVALTAAVGSSAQTMYRCGNNFSQVPCGPDAQRIGPAPPAELKEPVDIPPPADQIAANSAICEAKTRASMKDPESARIKGLSRLGTQLQYYQGRSFYGVTYFLTVNAKNGYGGYTGDQLYQCVFSPDEKTWLYSQSLAR